MEFFVPGSEKDIDWDTQIKYLDKEFQKITKASVSGQKHTDKLVEVTLKNQSKKWVLIHIEIQSQKKKIFLKGCLFTTIAFMTGTTSRYPA